VKLRKKFAIYSNREGSGRLSEAMNREFHIVAKSESRFTIKGDVGAPRRVFSSLFEAARHVRSSADAGEGWVVIFDESENSVNRIPFLVQ